MKDLLNSKVQPQSLVDAVTERLETAIFSGELEPGSRLSEQGMAKALGVSRGPLREAIRRLEGRRLVQRTPNIGVRVVDLTLKDFTELFQVQESLQGLACSLAARNMSDGDIATLRKLHEQGKQRMAKKRGDNPYDEVQDVEFHNHIMNSSRNERLAQMLDEDLYFMIRANRYKFTRSRERVEALHQEHEAIVAAIEARDPAAAERAMRTHIANACHYLQKQMADKESERLEKLA